MGKRKSKSKTGKRLEKEISSSTKKISNAEERDVTTKDDSLAEVLNNALILDESTEVVVVSSADIKNNNEKLPPPGQVSQTLSTKSSSDQEYCDSASKKSSSSSRNYSYTSSGAGDNSWMEKDPFEVSYSGSINYNSVSKPGTKQGNLAPGGELRTIEDYISLGVPRVIAEMKHPLNNGWSFWYFSNDKSRSWNQNQNNVATVDTIEDFWQVYNYIEPASQLKIGCDYALFKKGIMPDWEDYQNKFGGRWIIERPDPARVEEMDDYWLETLFMMIGEHVDPYNDLINGAVIQSKRGRFRLAIWLKDARDTEGITQIGNYIKKILKVPKMIEFSVHADDPGSRSRSSPANKNRLCL